MLAPSAFRDAREKRLTTLFEGYLDHETGSPPLYYATAAVWYDLGRLAGLNGANAAYSVRFLNIPLLVALILARAWILPGLIPLPWSPWPSRG